EVTGPATIYRDLAHLLAIIGDAGFQARPDRVLVGAEPGADPRPGTDVAAETAHLAPRPVHDFENRIEPVRTTPARHHPCPGLWLDEKRDPCQNDTGQDQQTHPHCHSYLHAGQRTPQGWCRTRSASRSWAGIIPEPIPD